MLDVSTRREASRVSLSASAECGLTDLLRHYAITRDAKARDEIVASTLWLATRSARLFADRGEPFDDLVQVARLGLLRAIDRFEPRYEVPFSAFATTTIMGELRRHFRDYTWTVHVPRRAKDTSRAVSKATEELAKELGRIPRIPEIAVRLHISPETVLEAVETRMAYRPKSLDGSAATAHQHVAPLSEDDAVLDREVVCRLLDRLGMRERTALYLRFFENMSQQEIATQIGTSQVHVGRLIATSLRELNHHLGGRAGLCEPDVRRCGLSTDETLDPYNHAEKCSEAGDHGGNESVAQHLLEPECAGAGHQGVGDSKSQDERQQ
jgi:RNA polymerase sigma-B factor